MKIKINRSSITGTIAVPGSKSHSIRAIAAAAMSAGTSIIHSPLYSEDTLAALKAAEQLGAKIEQVNLVGKVNAIPVAFGQPVGTSLVSQCLHDFQYINCRRVVISVFVVFIVENIAAQGKGRRREEAGVGVQSEAHSSGAANVDAALYELHADYNRGPFALRALYANWDMDDSINLTKDGASEQTGWYVEPAYKFTDALGVFARYGEWDNQGAGGGNTEYQQIDVGVNYWLNDTVVLKFDYQDQDAPAGKDEYDGFNLGIGWSY